MSALSALFTLIGLIEIGFGLLCLPTALFVGPQLLVVALGSVSLGIASLTVARGFRRDAKWASWTAVALCAIVISVAALAIYQAANAAEWDSVAVWGSVATFFVVMTLAVYTRRTEVGK